MQNSTADAYKCDCVTPTSSHISVTSTSHNH